MVCPQQLKATWERRVSHPLAAVLKAGLTPTALARAVALGVVCGIFPVPGATSIVAGICTVSFGVNAVVVQITNLLMTPVNLATLIPFIRVGMVVLGEGSESAFSLEAFKATVANGGVVEALHQFVAPLLHGVLGWALFAPLIAGAVFVLALPLARRWARRREARAAAAAACAAAVRTNTE
jgi:uncharacterized protein (DUF2062 family)